MSDDQDKDENKLIAERRRKLGSLREQGIAYPNDFRRDVLAAQLLSTYEDRDAAWLEANAVRVRVAGRMMFRRPMGKASFANIADRSGQIQLFLQDSALGAAYEAFRDYDVGDMLGATGELFLHPHGRALGAGRGLLRLLAKLPPRAAAPTSGARCRRHRAALPAALRGSGS